MNEKDKRYLLEAIVMLVDHAVSKGFLPTLTDEELSKWHKSSRENGVAFFDTLVSDHIQCELRLDSHVRAHGTADSNINVLWNNYMPVLMQTRDVIDRLIETMNTKG